MKHFFYTKYTICGIFLSFAAVDISYEQGDQVHVEYDGKFFLGEISHVRNNQQNVKSVEMANK